MQYFAFPNHFFFYLMGAFYCLLLLFTCHLHTHISKHRMHSLSLSHQSNKQDQLKWEIEYTPFSVLFCHFYKRAISHNILSLFVLSEATDDEAFPRCLANALGSIYSVTSGASLVSDHMQLEHKNTVLEKHSSSSQTSETSQSDSCSRSCNRSASKTHTFT